MQEMEEISKMDWYKKELKKYKTKHGLLTKRSTYKRIIREVLAPQVISAEKDFFAALLRIREEGENKLQMDSIIESFRGKPIFQFTDSNLFTKCMSLPMSKKERRWLVIWKQYILYHTGPEQLAAYNIDSLGIPLPPNTSFPMYDKKDVVFR